MRVELRDGQWAELRERITHGQDNDIRRARQLGLEGAVDWADVLVATFVESWHVLDLDGQAIPWEGVSSLARAPDDAVDALWEPVTKLYKASTDPNPPTPPSSPEEPSEAS